VRLREKCLRRKAINSCEPRTHRTGSTSQEQTRHSDSSKKNLAHMSPTTLDDDGSVCESAGRKPREKPTHATYEYGVVMFKPRAGGSREMRVATATTNFMAGFGSQI
jgi:hypothetical protein